MTGSGEPPARASDADRDRVVRLLRDAIIDGRLSQDTFVLRIDRALHARHRDALGALVADLTPVPASSPPVSWRRRLTTVIVLNSTLRLPGCDRPVLVIGRRPNCDIHLPDKRVSRVHAVLMLFEESWYIEDLRSTNGTFINGTRIHRRVPVRGGDQVNFAGTKFRLTAPAASWRS